MRRTAGTFFFGVGGLDSLQRAGLSVGNIPWQSLFDRVMDRGLDESGTFTGRKAPHMESLGATAFAFGSLSRILPHLPKSRMEDAKRTVKDYVEKFEESAGKPGDSPRSGKQVDKLLRVFDETEVEAAAFLVKALVNLAPIVGYVPDLQKSKRLSQLLDFLILHARSNPQVQLAGHAALAVKALAGLKGFSGTSILVTGSGGNSLEVDICTIDGRSPGSGLSVSVSGGSGTEETLTQKGGTTCTFTGPHPGGKRGVVKVSKGSKAPVSAPRLLVSGVERGEISPKLLSLEVFEAPSASPHNQKMIYSLDSPALTASLFTDDSDLFFNVAVGEEQTQTPLRPRQASVLVTLERPETELPEGLPVSRLLHMSPRPGGKSALRLVLGNKRLMQPVNGQYSFEIIIGDESFERPLRHKVSGVNVRFGSQVKTVAVPTVDGRERPVLASFAWCSPKPLIEHQFGPELDTLNPPRILSILFLVLVVALPAAAFAVLLKRQQANLGLLGTAMKGSPFVPLFVMMLCLSFGFILFFWFFLTCLRAIYICIPLLTVSILTGHPALCRMKTLRTGGGESEGKKTGSPKKAGKQVAAAEGGASPAGDGDEDAKDE